MDRPDPKITDQAFARLGDFFPRGGITLAATEDDPSPQENDMDEHDGDADHDREEVTDASVSVIVNQDAASDRAAIELPLKKLPEADKDAPTDVIGIRLATAPAVTGAATNELPAAAADLGNLGASVPSELSHEVDEDLADVWDMGGEEPAAPVAPAPPPAGGAPKPAPPPNEQTRPLEMMAAASAAPLAPPPAPAPAEPAAAPVAANDVHSPEPAAPAGGAPPSDDLSADSRIPVAASPATPDADGTPTEGERRPAKPSFDDLMAPEFDAAPARAKRPDGSYVVSNDRLWEFLMHLDVTLSNFPASGEVETDEEIRLRNKCRMVVMELFARGEALRYFNGQLQEYGWQLKIEDVHAVAERALEQALHEQDVARKDALLATYLRAMEWLDEKERQRDRHAATAQPFTRGGRTPTDGRPSGPAPVVVMAQGQGGLPPPQTAGPAPGPAKGRAVTPHPLWEKMRRHKVVIIALLATLVIGIAIADVISYLRERGALPLLASAPSVSTAEKSVSEPPQISASTRKLFPMTSCDRVDATKSSFDCSKGKGTSRKIRGTDIWELCGCERWQ